MESGREGGGEVKTVQTPCLLGPLPQQNLWGLGHTAGGQKVNRKEEERRQTHLFVNRLLNFWTWFGGGEQQTWADPRDGCVTGNG